jgi:uncharacterized cofD-like protein
LYTSILPNLLVDGVAATIHGIRAVRLFIANLMTEPGETENFTLDDHLQVIRDHTGFDLFDYVLVNCRPLPASLTRDYRSRGSSPIRSGRQLTATAARVIRRPLAAEFDGNKIRHEPHALAAAILEIAARGRARTRN